MNLLTNNKRDNIKSVVQPLISVIVPVYKVEKFLCRCVDSIIAQTYDNLEIILVDDGSPDNCGNICDEYAEADKRVKVVHKKNGGLSDARNVGMENSKGELIAFVDSDDWLSLDYFEVLYRNLLNTDADISICDFLRLDNELDANVSSMGEIETFTNLEAIEQLFGRLYLQFVIACGKLYKRKVIGDKSFPIGKIHEDEYLTYRLLYDSHRVCYTSHKMYYYWQHSGSIMSNTSASSYKNKNEAFEQQAVFFKNKGISHLEKKAMLRAFSSYSYAYNKNLFNDKNETVAFLNDYKSFLWRLLSLKGLSLVQYFKFSFLLLSPTIANKIFAVIRKMRK